MSKKINFNLSEFLEEFKRTYMDLYNNWKPADYLECVQAFDRFVGDKNHAEFVGEFAYYRGDLISSDREAAAFMMILAKMDAEGTVEETETEVEEPDLPIPVPRTVISYTTADGGAEIAMFDTDDEAEVLQLFCQLLLESEPTLISVDCVSH